MDPNELTVEEFIEKLDVNGFKASPNRNVIVIQEADENEPDVIADAER